MGWSFEIIENLHAKFYLMDQKDLAEKMKHLLLRFKQQETKQAGLRHLSHRIIKRLEQARYS